MKFSSCRNLNGGEVVVGNGNKLPATGRAKHVCCGNLAQGVGGGEVKPREA